MPAFPSSTVVIYVFARNCAILVLLKKNIALFKKRKKLVYEWKKIMHITSLVGSGLEEKYQYLKFVSYRSKYSCNVKQHRIFCV